MFMAKYAACAAPLSLRQLPRQGSQDAGGDSAGGMFHGKQNRPDGIREDIIGAGLFG